MAKKKNLDAIALLKADHRKVEGLFAKFEKTRDGQSKKSLAEQICTELTIHAMIEEEIFYPVCAAVVEEDIRLEAYVEHDGAKVLIAEIEASSPDDEFYDAKMKVLSEQVKHHIKEEEKRGEGLFAQAREADFDLEALGLQLQERKDELMSQIDAHGLPAPETRSFTGHELVQGTRPEPTA